MEKKTKWKQKYDYASLKQEFLKSDYLEVKSFLSDKWVAYNTRRRENTKWWTKDKKAMKEKTAQKTIEKIIEKESTKLSQQIDVDKLIRMKHEFFDTIDMAIDQLQNSDKVNMKDLILWLNAIKTELWETTQINQNKNETEITGMNVKITGV